MAVITVHVFLFMTLRHRMTVHIPSVLCWASQDRESGYTLVPYLRRFSFCQDELAIRIRLIDLAVYQWPGPIVKTVELGDKPHKCSHIASLQQVKRLVMRGSMVIPIALQANAQRGCSCPVQANPNNFSPICTCHGLRPQYLRVPLSSKVNDNTRGEGAFKTFDHWRVIN